MARVTETERSIAKLNPLVGCLLTMAVEEMKQNGVSPLIVETTRVKERQYYLYGKGRTTIQCVNAGMPSKKARQYAKPTEAKVTWTLNSIHIQKKAVDVIPLREGKAVWDANDKDTRKIIKIMTRHGFEAGANWESSPDSPHFQIKGSYKSVFTKTKNNSYITKMIQRQLKEKGYYEGTIDGDWGRLTTKAVNRFKKKANWRANDKVGDATLRRLFS